MEDAFFSACPSFRLKGIYFVTQHLEVVLFIGKSGIYLHMFLRCICTNSKEILLRKQQGTNLTYKL